jgi:rRNA maturation endonuclease Nob1
MAESGKMICPRCGAEMNRHAEKVDYSSGLADPEAADTDFGGLLEEFHTCPECGLTLSRRAA